MPRKRQLTWHAARSCWKKHIGGKDYYLATGGACRGKTDEEGYQQALREYYALRAKLAAENAPANGYEPSETIRKIGGRTIVEQDSEISPDSPIPPVVDRAERNRRLLELRETAEQIPAGPEREAFLYETVKQVFDELSRPAPIEPPAPPTTQDNTVYGARTAYLKMQQSRVAADQLSESGYAVDEQGILPFVHSLLSARVKTVAEIDEATLSRYQAEQLGKIADGSLAPRTVQRNLGVAKKWLQWCHKQSILDTLPRNLTADYARVKKQPPKPKFFTIDEIREIYRVSGPRVQLYMTLGVNCGYYAIDIATLTHDMIDWKTSIITRKRHKTEQDQCHKLWPITRELLKAESTRKKSGVMLLTKTGRSVLRRKINEESGKEVRAYDGVGYCFGNLLKRAGIVGRSFSNLRDTGSNLIAKQYQDKPFLVDMYLAHGEQRMARFYVERHYDFFWEALDWLGNTLDLRSIKNE
jgi:integrase